MTDSLVMQLQMSKIHLALTLCIYTVSIFFVWYYAPYFWLSAIISLALFIDLSRFLTAEVLRNQAQSISKITLEEHAIIIQKNDQSIERWGEFHSAYQSRFLVIIKIAKKTVVIFKDGVESQSLSALNRALNA